MTIKFVCLKKKIGVNNNKKFYKTTSTINSDID